MSDAISTKAALAPFDEAVDIDGSFGQLLTAYSKAPDLAARRRIDGVLVGRLVGFADDTATPLVTYAGQPVSAALAARATMDLHGDHIDREIVLMFEDGNPCRPIIVGCLREAQSQSLPHTPARVEVDRDGQRLIVSAKEQLVLRCGKASITLTRAGKIVVQGTYVSNRSSGVMKIKGGSVQIN